jgi:hypothetical protein
MRTENLMIQGGDPLLDVRLEMIDHSGLETARPGGIDTDSAQQGLRDHLSLRVPCAPY